MLDPTNTPPPGATFFGSVLLAVNFSVDLGRLLALLTLFSKRQPLFFSFCKLAGDYR